MPLISANVTTPATTGLVLQTVGAAGAAGAAGATGPPGATGSVGITGTVRGAYNAGTTYTAGPPPDVVLASNGHWYVSLTNANIGHDPTTDGGVHWADEIPSSVAKVQAAGGQTVLYLDRHTGSDSNDGLSIGFPLATLDKAVATLNQGVGGTILVSSQQPGPYTLSAPVHAVVPITIRGITSWSNNEIDRGFGTPNSRSVWDAVTTVSGTTVASATAAFTAPDVNRVIEIYGAGTGGGTYYDFISSVTDGSHVVVANGSGTVIARPATNDTTGVGIRMRIYGDWNRVVTDAAITSGTSILTSATAAFTTADIGTEVVIGGAGHGGQALRGTIKSVQSGTQATLVGRATITVTGARCVLGLISGDMITWHVPNCGLENMFLFDTTVGANRIGAALKYVVDDGYSGGSTGQHALQNVSISNSDPAGAWEHGLEFDGSWNQTAGGGGVRKSPILEVVVFGCRRPTETIRINSAVHAYFTGGGLGGAAPTTIAQGIMILDPGHTRAGGSGTVADIHFAAFDGGDCAYFTEGQYTTYVGGRLGIAGGSPALPANRFSIQTSIISANVFVSCMNVDATTGAAQTAQSDQGTGNMLWTNRDATNNLMDAGSIAGGGTLSPKIDVARMFKVTATGATMTIAAMSRTVGGVGLGPKGTSVTFQITNSSGGALVITWSGNYKQSYTPPANGKTNVVAFVFDGTTFNQMAAQGPDY